LADLNLAEVLTTVEAPRERDGFAFGLAPRFALAFPSPATFADLCEAEGFEGFFAVFFEGFLAERLPEGFALFFREAGEAFGISTFGSGDSLGSSGFVSLGVSGMGGTFALDKLMSQVQM
jgi:hypothetical protein